MHRVAQLIRVIGVNSVPLYGISRGWTPATILAIYWFENLLASVLVASRIVIHRRLTQKRGHYMVESHSKRGVSYQRGSFLHHFLLLSTLFTAAHGIFVVAAIAILASNGQADVAASLPQLGAALLVTSISLLTAFLVDLSVIRHQPFSWIRAMRNQSIGRTFVIHLTIVIGMLVVGITNATTAFFIVFAVLKTLFDVFQLLPRGEVGVPPPWLADAMQREARGEPLEEHEVYWIDRWRVDSDAAKEAELPIEAPAAAAAREGSHV